MLANKSENGTEKKGKQWKFSKNEKKSYVLFRMWKKFELIPGATGKPTGILKIFYTN